jgi:hypothetical protein
MADLDFAHGAGMQDGAIENDYMDFIHKYMAAFAVRFTRPKSSPLLISSQLRASAPLVQFTNFCLTSPKTLI